MTSSGLGPSAMKRAGASHRTVRGAPDELTLPFLQRGAKLNGLGPTADQAFRICMHMRHVFASRERKISSPVTSGWAGERT